MFNKKLEERVKKVRERVFKNNKGGFFGSNWGLFSQMSIEEDLKDVNERIRALQDYLKIEFKSVSETKTYVKKGGK